MREARHERPHNVRFHSISFPYEKFSKSIERENQLADARAGGKGKWGVTA